MAVVTALPRLASPVAPAAPQRAVGALGLSVGPLAGTGRSTLVDLRQEGCLRALFPRPNGPALQAVMLNTAGGLTGGDRIAVTARALPGADLILSSQAAERAYRATGPTPARSSLRLAVDAGARLDWLPQETILFDGAALTRSLHLDLSGDATALVCEALVFGRQAMGETVGRLSFRDRWEVRRDGRLILADVTRIETADAAALMSGPGTGGGARALATLLLAGPGAEAALPVLRAHLPATAGASLPAPGLLFARILAPDGYALRAILMPALARLAGRPLPKVWSL